MDYKTELQSNNTDLQALIAKANALPDAGSGGTGGANIETCTIRLLAGPTIIAQTMQVIASAYENNAISTINQTANVFFDEEEDGVNASVTAINNVINNTPVTLVFSTVVPSSPVATIGDAVFICNNENTLSFTFTPDNDMGLCNIRL